MALSASDIDLFGDETLTDTSAACKAPRAAGPIFTP